jgi:RHS repeat-associated protein
VQQVGGYAEYRYDGLGRRIEKKLVKPVAIGSEEDLADCVEDGFGTTITRWVYDAEDILLEYDVALTLNPNYPWWGPQVNTESVLVARYTHGMGIDEPLSFQRHGEAWFYEADGLLSVAQVTDTSGMLVRSYLYTSFGMNARSTGMLDNSLRYAARDFDKESGNYYLRMRDYSPSLGRFLSSKRVMWHKIQPSTINAYTYALLSPLTFLDPSGDEPVTITVLLLLAWKTTTVTTAVVTGIGGLILWSEAEEQAAKEREIECLAHRVFRERRTARRLEEANYQQWMKEVIKPHAMSTQTYAESFGWFLVCGSMVTLRIAPSLRLKLWRTGVPVF